MKDKRLDSMNDANNKNLLFKDEFEYVNEPIKYIIKGEPIPWKRPGRNQLHVFDTQKKQKLDFQLQLQSQHESKKFYEGPLALVVYFYMGIPKTSLKQQQLLLNTYYPYTGDLDNLIKFVQDASQGTLFENDKTICIISASKRYGSYARTEFYILELK